MRPTPSAPPVIRKLQRRPVRRTTHPEELLPFQPWTTFGWGGATRGRGPGRSNDHRGRARPARLRDRAGCLAVRRTLGGPGHALATGRARRSRAGRLTASGYVGALSWGIPSG